MPVVDDILSAMEARGWRATIQRRIIIEEIAKLSGGKTGFTCDELWHAVRQHHPETGRATVFRTIEIVSSIEYLDRIGFFDGSERYHLTVPGKHHHHLTCVACHQVVEIVACPLPLEIGRTVNDAGFTLISHRLDLFGACQKCRSNGKYPASE